MKENMASISQRKKLDKLNIVPYLQSATLSELSASILLQSYQYVKGE